MTEPLLITLLPVAAGLALAGLSRVGGGEGVAVNRVARATAGLAALLVVLLAFAPTGGHTPSPWAVLAFVLALVLPLGAERLLRRRQADPSHVGLGLGLLGVVLHQLMDGAQVGAAYTLHTSPRAVGLAIAAHSVPLVAVLGYGIAREEGLRALALRGALLLGVTAAGVLVGLNGVELLPFAEDWLPAAVAGLLLHVVVHDLGHRHP